MSIRIEEYMKLAEEKRKEDKEFRKKLAEVRRQELIKQGVIIETKDEGEKKNNFYGDCDSIYTMDNTVATILYIITMIGGSIFNDRILIWIGATVVWFLHITRHSRK